MLLYQCSFINFEVDPSDTTFTCIVTANKVIKDN